MRFVNVLLLVGLTTCSLLPGVALAQSAPDDVVEKWVEAFRVHRIDRATLEQVIGRPLTKMTFADTQKLQEMLATARAKATEEPTPLMPAAPYGRQAKSGEFLPNDDGFEGMLPVLPAEAEKLRDAVLGKQGPYDAVFDELGKLIERIPHDGPPAEKLAIDKLMEFWTKFKAETKRVRELGPQAAAAANDYRAALTEGLTTFQQIDADNLPDLTLLKEAGIQAFQRKLDGVNARMRGWQEYREKMDHMDRYIDRLLSMLALMRGIADAADQEDRFRKIFEEHVKAFDRASQINRDLAQTILDGSKESPPSPGQKLEGRPMSVQ